MGTSGVETSLVGFTSEGAGVVDGAVRSSAKEEDAGASRNGPGGSRYDHSTAMGRRCCGGLAMGIGVLSISDE